MARNQRTPERLKDASAHVAYEIGMLVKTCKEIEKCPPTDPEKRTYHNALLESFTIHTRNLYDFLYEYGRSDDIVAIDYSDQVTAWRDPKPDSLVCIKNEISKRLAHLTYRRTEIGPEAKSWPVGRIANDLKEVLQRFLDHVDEEKLHPDLKAWKSNILDIRITRGTSGITSSEYKWESDFIF